MNAPRMAGLSAGKPPSVAHATDDKESSSNDSAANIMRIDSETSLPSKELEVKTRALSGRDR